MNQKLANKVAVVTGACGGVGTETSKLFAKAGAKVMMADINEKAGQKLAQEINSNGGQATFCHVDVTNLQQIKNCVDSTVQKYGKLDILINIACVMGIEKGWIHEVTEKMFDQDIAINLKAAFFFIRYALPFMMKNKDGRIVNFSTVAAVRGELGHSVYGAAKAGQEALTRLVATEYGKKGIRCNCIRPGIMTNPSWENTNFGQKYIKHILSHIPGKKIGHAYNAAPVALFLADDDSAYVNGQILTMDGGLTCHEPQWKEDLSDYNEGLR